MVNTLQVLCTLVSASLIFAAYVPEEQPLTAPQASVPGVPPSGSGPKGSSVPKSDGAVKKPRVKRPVSGTVPPKRSPSTIIKAPEAKEPNKDQNDAPPAPVGIEKDIEYPIKAGFNNKPEPPKVQPVPVDSSAPYSPKISPESPASSSPASGDVGTPPPAEPEKKDSGFYGFGANILSKIGQFFAKSDKKP